MADSKDAATGEARVVSTSRGIVAPAERVFELIAHPAAQPRWDGNDNLAAARSRCLVTHAYDWTDLAEGKP